MKRRILAIVCICVILCTFVFALPSSADYSKTKYVYKRYAWSYSYQSFPVSDGFTVNEDGIVYDVIGRDTAGTVVRYGEDGLQKTFYVGDVLEFTTDFSSMPTFLQDFLTNCCERVWYADDTSPYNGIYDTISHYLFNDTFENVPFGTFWVSGISIIALLFVVAVPFLLIFWTIRFIGG